MKKIAHIKANITFSIFKEGKSFVAYSPILDLSTSASTYDLAVKRFNEIVKIFLSEIIKKGTADEVLASLGWQKIKSQWMPPVMVGHESVPVAL